MSKNSIIIGLGGGFDIFGSLPKILKLIQNNSIPPIIPPIIPNIVIISNSFAHTGYAKLARDNYKIGCENNPENITLLNDDTLIKFITNKCYKINDFTQKINLNLYHPEGLMFHILGELKKKYNFTFEIYNIFGWINYPKHEELVSNITEPATFNETYIALQKIIMPLTSSDYEIIMQDCGCDVLPNEKTLLNTDLKYGMGSQYEEMKIVATIYLLVNNKIINPDNIKLCVINLGGDLAGRYTKYFLEKYSKYIKSWVDDPFVDENFKLLNGTSADSFANISMKACYDKHKLGKDNYNKKVSDYQNKINNHTKSPFYDYANPDIIKDTMFMLESYPGNPSIERILSLDSNNRQKMLTLPLTIENQITELIIPWTEYEPPNYIQLFDEIKNLNFEEYHKWIDNYYKQLLMQNMSDEMKEFVKDLHYNYRWSAWSKTIHDIYDYIKGQYINYNFASDQFIKLTNIWTLSDDTKTWTRLLGPGDAGTNSSNVEIKLKN
jgi:hypothetical protein